MAGFQQTFIIGNVGRDPDMRYTPSGMAVCDFSVAVSRSWTDKSTGERQEETTWFKVSAWRGLAETCHKYITKGRQVMVSGRIKAGAWVGDDGEARATLELTATEVQFLGRREDKNKPAEAEELPF